MRRGDPRHRSSSTSGVRREQSRRRGIATGLTALAFLAAAAAPASAAVSTRPAAHQSVLASTCDRNTFFSGDQWSKGNVQLCVDVLQRADGTKALQASFYGDFYYYWGAAWYSDGDCIYGCHLTGRFALRKDGGAPAFGGISATLSGNSGSASHTFEVDSGRYQLTAGVHKEGGYWRNQGNISSSELQMNTLKVDVTVP
ncbi:hypothetical protein [Streptosporangium roseum]|uniref:hypothetical protein n=1 Tax=Streptosporangium roseum TaxID=2001 RepID=UPI00332D99DB